MRRRAALLVLVLASCSVTKRHPRLATVAATTVIFSVGIGAPLSNDCDNSTSRCSTRHVAAVFGIGAVVGLGIGLLAVRELEVDEPSPHPRLHDPTRSVCGRARERIALELAATCTEGIVEFPSLDACECRRRTGGGGGYLCAITATVACGSAQLCGSCRCAESTGASDGCSCFATTCESAAGGVP